MGQVPSTQDIVALRRKIAWRRAADELLIAAIFAEDAPILRDDAVLERKQRTSIGSDICKSPTATPEKLRSAA